MINILHLTPWNLGGSTSYVINLAKTFEVAGVPFRIARLSKRTERKRRQIGEYGVWYQNVSFADAYTAKGTWLLASAPTDKTRAVEAHELVCKSHGAYVFHDPNEIGMYPHWEYADRKRVICIRETGLDTMPEGAFIPHPYVRELKNNLSATRRYHAVSIARISAVKNSMWLLEANEKLVKRRRVALAGSLNRFWWNFNVKPKHPEWQMPEGNGFPRVAGAAAKLCADYNYMVDLTIFKNDGGGTQYSFLEAMDAGAVPVMTKDWCSYPGIARKLGFQVSNTEELLDFLKSDCDASTYRSHNYAYLDRVHAPKRVADMYVEYLLGI